MTYDGESHPSDCLCNDCRSLSDDDLTSSTEQPEHEEARRLAKDVAGARARLVEGTPEKYPGALARVRILDAEAVLALLSKAEQERDEALHSVVGKHELEQARAEAFLLKGRVEAAERELERLREAAESDRRYIVQLEKSRTRWQRALDKVIRA